MNLKDNMLGVFMSLYTLVLSIYSFYLKYFHLFYVLIGWVYFSYFAYLFPTSTYWNLVHSTNITSPGDSSLIFLISTSHSFWAPWLFLWKCSPLAQALCVCWSIPPGSGHLLLWTRSISCLCVSSMKRPGTLWEIIQRDFISSNRIISRGFLFLPILFWFAND